jgi:hypothetical protein
MRSLVLGAFIFASFGLTANAAEPPSDVKVADHRAKPACHWVTADRTLRLLRDISPGERRIAIGRPVLRPVSRPVAAPARGPVVKVAARPVTPVRAVSRPEPVRFVSRAEPVRLPTHVSLVVGIGF